MYTRTSLS
ncbi:hypothetical protein PENSTE_c009G01167 [Penicillium steckii]|uniref:Uncharacterized protein n=1 Tax=Penicillium steckii TaxID=303698 RepID=A0A1V6TAX9_9EURO|nr:hypothetical protein PENSTE_c009G01167 [Penicillium steckii]